MARRIILPGGKGINVSIVLSNLGHRSVALGFMAGFTGDDIAELMKGFGCGVDLIRVRKGFSRINVKLKSDEEISTASRCARRMK